MISLFGLQLVDTTMVRCDKADTFRKSPKSKVFGLSLKISCVYFSCILSPVCCFFAFLFERYLVLQGYLVHAQANILNLGKMHHYSGYLFKQSDPCHRSGQGSRICGNSFIPFFVIPLFSSLLWALLGPLLGFLLDRFVLGFERNLSFFQNKIKLTLLSNVKEPNQRHEA